MSQPLAPACWIRREHQRCRAISFAGTAFAMICGFNTALGRGVPVNKQMRITQAESCLSSWSPCKRALSFCFSALLSFGRGCPRPPTMLRQSFCDCWISIFVISHPETPFGQLQILRHLTRKCTLSPLGSSVTEVSCDVASQSVGPPADPGVSCEAWLLWFRGRKSEASYVLGTCQKVGA